MAERIQRGFDATAIYRTYDEYANDAERYYLEYFLRDAYEAPPASFPSGSSGR